MKPFCCAWTLVSFSVFLFSQSPTECHPQKSREFDFWIGRWEVLSGNQLAGTNRIQPILGGCILQENWEGSSGQQGTSLNFYNPSKQRWEQFWVWKNGQSMHFTGNLVDGKMILTGTVENPRGVSERHRITWTPNPDGTVRQYWEKTALNEEKWTPLFDGIYKKATP